MALEPSGEPGSQFGGGSIERKTFVESTVIYILYVLNTVVCTCICGIITVKNGPVTGCYLESFAKVCGRSVVRQLARRLHSGATMDLLLADNLRRTERGVTK